MRTRLAPFAAAGLLLAGCATVPPRPTSAQHGVLVARLVVRGAVLGFLRDTATAGVVVKLGPDGRPQDGPGAASGYAKDGYFYFFDLPAGRYALVAASFPARGTRYRVLLPDADLGKEAVELKAGEAAFLGDFLLDGRFPEFPEAVDRAVAVVGRWLTFFLRHPPLPRDADPRSHERGPEAEGKALLSARAALAGTLWHPLIVERFRRAGVREPAATTGGLRPKTLELKQESRFAWRDVLGWGEPIRSENGLEWRSPKGGARAAVWFTTATAAGFRGYEEAVRQLRAGVGAEGSSALEEVRVATRAAVAGRVTRWLYPESRLVGDSPRVMVTETVLVPDASGMYTARLRADREEFERALPSFRRLLEQLVLGPPAAKGPVKQDSVIFYPQ